MRKAEAVVALAARSTAEHILVSALRRNTIASVRDTIRKLPNTIRKLPNTIRKLYACNHDEIRWSRNTIRKLLIRHRTRPDIADFHVTVSIVLHLPREAALQFSRQGSDKHTSISPTCHAPISSIYQSPILSSKAVRHLMGAGASAGDVARAAAAAASQSERN